MSYHKGSVAKALVDLFPDIGIERKKMWPKCMLFYLFFLFNSIDVISSAAWHEAKYRRKFFEIYAKENEFDPLIAQNWYLQPKRKILANKVESLSASCYFLLHFTLCPPPSL